ncbi:MAG TPA: hypothetical protein VI894_00785, partial [Candidatus Nanoarchaeia archaeon]|nr:hypothetical protein [Candidatus Nanoarchaeia archaeon]
MPVIARDIYDQGIKEEYSKAKGLAREDDEEKRLRNEIEIAKKEELKESIEENWQIGKAVVGATGKAIAGYAKAGYGIAKGTYGAAKKTKDAGVAAVNGLQNAVSWTASNVILFLFAVIFVHAIDISLGFNNFITRFWLYMGLTVWAWLALFKQPGTKAEFRDLLVFILIPIILSYTIELVPLLKNEYTLLIFIFIWMIAGIYLASESLKEPMIISAVSLFLPYAIHFAEKTNAQIPLGYILIWIPPWILYLFFMSRAEGKFFNILKFAYTGALLIFLIIPTVASALSVPAYADFIKVNLKTDNAVKLMQDNFKISMGFIAKAITGGFTSIQKSYQAQIFYATHGYYQGETEDTKQFVGIRLLEPSIQNKLQYSPEEKFFETRTAIEAYNPKQKFKVAYSCTTQSDECFQLTEKTECPATASTITPKEELVLSEQSYYTEATCYPKLQLGWNSVSISTTLLDFTTESRLTTFFIDFDAMNQIVASYRREKNIQTEVDILQIPQFSSIRNVKTVSISDPGPVKLIIAVPTKQPI